MQIFHQHHHVHDISTVAMIIIVSSKFWLYIYIPLLSPAVSPMSLKDIKRYRWLSHVKPVVPPFPHSKPRSFYPSLRPARALHVPCPPRSRWLAVPGELWIILMNPEILDFGAPYVPGTTSYQFLLGLFWGWYGLVVDFFFFEGWASNIGCGWFTLLVLPCLVKKWLLSGIPKSQHGILRLKLDIKDYIKWYVPSEWQMNSSIKPNQPTDQRFSQHMVQTWTILKRPIDVNNLGTMPSRLFDGVAGQWQCCLTITRSSKCYWQSIMI